MLDSINKIKQPEKLDIISLHLYISPKDKTKSKIQIFHNYAHTDGFCRQLLFWLLEFLVLQTNCLLEETSVIFRVDVLIPPVKNK
jgi:hypothetical protein